MSYPILKMVAGKEANVGFRHPWVFSGALEDGSKPEHGALVYVADRNGRIIGTGTFSRSSAIAVRVFIFGESILDQAWLTAKIKDVHEKRVIMGYGPGTNTTGYRCVFGEADGIPGLVVDRYEDVIVFQIATAGLDKMRDVIVKSLFEVFKPRFIVERSDMPSRREENLENEVGIRYAKDDKDFGGQVDFLEQGRAYTANVLTGQKTGFFFDQKDLRTAISTLAKGKSVLNLFSYTGAASLAAFAGGAVRVHNVDGSEDALALLAKQATDHKISPDICTIQKTDIFQWLGRAEGEYDVVLMDPPALIKSLKDTEEGKKAYHFLNRAAMKLVKDRGLFITSSCSHLMSEED